jgi:hypothetical protein
MTTLNLAFQFSNADGTPADLTLKQALISALLETPAAEHPLAPEEKLRRYGVFKTIQSAGDTVELHAEDVALLKKVTGALYTPLVLGQCHELLGH